MIMTFLVIFLPLLAFLVPTRSINFPLTDRDLVIKCRTTTRVRANFRRDANAIELMQIVGERKRDRDFCAHVKIIVAYITCN